MCPRTITHNYAAVSLRRWPLPREAVTYLQRGWATPVRLQHCDKTRASKSLLPLGAPAARRRGCSRGWTDGPRCRHAQPRGPCARWCSMRTRARSAAAAAARAPPARCPARACTSPAPAAPCGAVVTQQRRPACPARHLLLSRMLSRAIPAATGNIRQANSTQVMHFSSLAH